MRKAFSIASAWMLAAMLAIGGYVWAADTGTSSKDSAKSKSTKSSSSDMSSSDMKMSGGSENVKKAQMALKDKGQDPGPIDGVMGPKTRAAIKSYQSANNLKPTGQLDAATAKSLGVESASSSGSSASSSEKSSSKSAAKSGSADTGGASSSSSSKTSKSSSSDTGSGSSFGSDLSSGRNAPSSREKK